MIIRFRPPAFGLALVIALGIPYPAANAQTIVAPNGNASVEGDSDNAYPFNIGFTELPSIRYQQVYDKSQFSALSGPARLTTIRFRSDGSTGKAFGPVIEPVRIDFSTTAAAENTLSTTFAENIGTDSLTVFDGDLVLSSANTGVGPRDFDIVINLATPFIYDPTKGNLLMEVRNFSRVLTGQFDSSSLSNDGTGRLYGSTVDATVGIVDPGGLVTQFSFAPVVTTPEPASMTFVLPMLVLPLRRRIKMARPCP